MRAIDGLTVHRLLRIALHGELHGLRRLRVGGFRVEYEVMADKIVVRAV